MPRESCTRGGRGTWVHQDEVLGVQDADDVLWVAVVDGDARVAALIDVHHVLEVQAHARLHHVHLAPHGAYYQQHRQHITCFKTTELRRDDALATPIGASREKGSGRGLMEEGKRKKKKEAQENE
jgi:hypothetical protein